MANLMQEGDAVVFFDAKRRFSSAFLNRNRKTRVFGVLTDLDGLIGEPYGSVYELTPASDKPKRILELVGREAAQTVTDGRDNRDVLDAADNQKLSMDQIEDLKAKAEHGSEIVEALIENSETFERKTEFAQEKYLSRKVKKYCSTFTALRPSVAAICETQFDWYSVKAGFLRVDALSVILSLANVGAYRRVLVVDNCLGLIAAGVNERLNGFGDICVGFFGKKPCKLESIKRFYPQQPSNLHKLPLTRLIELNQQRDDDGAESEGDVTDGDLFKELMKRGSVPKERLQNWLLHGFDSCILSDWKVHPSALIEGVLPLLAPSASFVIYSAGMTSLVECQHRLMQRHDVVRVELQELWWREYQVLPGRTRPMMDAKCPSGYILSGVKVIPPIPPVQPTSEKIPEEPRKKACIDAQTADSTEIC